MVWQMFDNSNAQALYTKLDLQTQRAIADEEDQYQVLSVNGDLLKPPPKRVRVSSRQASNSRMSKASPKPGLGKKTFSTGSSGSGNVTPIRNQSAGKSGPYANAGSASR